MVAEGLLQSSLRPACSEYSSARGCTRPKNALSLFLRSSILRARASGVSSYPPRHHRRKRGSGKIDVQNRPYMRIRDAQAHGDNLEVHVDDVEHQRLNAGFGEYAWQVLRCCLEESSARAPDRPACCFHAVDLGNGSESASACSCGVLLFAVGDEIQSGGADCEAGIG